MNTLVDTGPLVALLDRGQGESYQRCLRTRLSLHGRLITTWPCLTETMYFAGRLRGPQGQSDVWRLLISGDLIIHHLSSAEVDRMRELMLSYANVPMDFADASLVAAAESRRDSKIFTLDSDFYIYRLIGGRTLEIVP